MADSAWDAWDQPAPKPEPQPDPAAEAIKELAEAQALLDQHSAEFGDKMERASIASEPAPVRVDVGPGRPDDLRAEPPLPANDLGFETAPDFLARIKTMPPQSWLVSELIPDEGIVVWHGRPRSMKSLCALETSLALAHGRESMGNDRFSCPHGAQPVLYLTEEDSERLFAFRLTLLLNGQDVPPLLRLRVRPGWNLETRDGQAALLEAVHRCTPEPRVLVIDPARGSLPSVDGGPKDAAEAVGFLRLVLRETSVKTIVMPHHDVKPNAQKEDVRVRAERASGGIVFSIADCPVNFERVDERTCMAVPSHYKLSNDPLPFRVKFESATPIGEPFRDWLRPIADTQSPEQTTDERDRRRILNYLRDNRPSTTSEIDSGLAFSKGTAGRLLAQMAVSGQVEERPGDGLTRTRRARLWSLMGTAPPEEEEDEE